MRVLLHESEADHSFWGRAALHGPNIAVWAFKRLGNGVHFLRSTLEEFSNSERVGILDVKHVHIC